MGWDQKLSKYYEEKDPDCGLDTPEIDIIMSQYIASLLNSDSSLMLNHKFVIACTGWVEDSTARRIFATYQARVNSDKNFAEAALNTEYGERVLITCFDTTSAPHYDYICRLAVTKTWRLVTRLDTNACTILKELLKEALQSAYDQGFMKLQSKTRNLFDLKYALNKVVPLAAEVGIPQSEINDWVAKLKSVVCEGNRVLG